MQGFRCLRYAQTTSEPGESEAKSVSHSRALLALRGHWYCSITNRKRFNRKRFFPLEQLDKTRQCFLPLTKTPHPSRSLTLCVRDSRRLGGASLWLAPVPPARKHLSVPGFSMCSPALPREFGIGRAILSSGGAGAIPAWVPIAPIDVIVASSEIPVRDEEPEQAQGRVSRQPKTGPKSDYPLSPSVQKEPPACRSPKGRVNFADGGQPVPNHGATVSHTVPQWQGIFTYHRGCRVLFPSLGAVVPSTGAWDDSLHC